MSAPGPRRRWWIAWGGCFALGLYLLGVFVAGLARDMDVRAVTIALDLARAGRTEQRFHVLRRDARVLYLSSVNHTPPFGEPFQGRLRVRVVDPSGDPALEATLDRSAGHRRPDNMEWSTLGRLTPDARGRWALVAEVVEPDPAFQGVRSEVRLRPDRPSVGMEGLITYAALFPGMFLLLGSMLVAGGLRRRGGPTWPLLLSVAPIVLLILYRTLGGLVRAAMMG